MSIFGLNVSHLIFLNIWASRLLCLWSCSYLFFGRSFITFSRNFTNYLSIFDLLLLLACICNHYVFLLVFAAFNIISLRDFFGICNFYLLIFFTFWLCFRLLLNFILVGFFVLCLDLFFAAYFTRESIFWFYHFWLFVLRLDFVWFLFALFFRYLFSCLIFIWFVGWKSFFCWIRSLSFFLCLGWRLFLLSLCFVWHCSLNYYWLNFSFLIFDNCFCLFNSLLHRCISTIEWLTSFKPFKIASLISFALLSIGDFIVHFQIILNLLVLRFSNWRKSKIS